MRRLILIAAFCAIAVVAFQTGRHLESKAPEPLIASRTIGVAITEKSPYTPAIIAKVADDTHRKFAIGKPNAYQRNITVALGESIVEVTLHTIGACYHSDILSEEEMYILEFVMERMDHYAEIAEASDAPAEHRTATPAPIPPRLLLPMRHTPIVR